MIEREIYNSDKVSYHEGTDDQLTVSVAHYQFVSRFEYRNIHKRVSAVIEDVSYEQPPER